MQSRYAVEADRRQKPGSPKEWNSRRRATRWAAVAAGALAVSAFANAQQPVTVRTPATPLVVHDPYFSVWSFDDALNAGPTRHWTGTEQQLNGVVQVDGHPYRFIGDWRGIQIGRAHV